MSAALLEFLAGDTGLKYRGRLSDLETVMRVVAGSASVGVGRELAAALQTEFVDAAFEKHPGGFPDGEQYVRVLSQVRGEHVLLVQTTFPDSKIVELFLLHDALAEAGAERITLVVPYFGYGRQDKKFEEGEAVSARALARRLQMGVDEIITVSVHNPEILAFFDIPGVDVSGTPALVRSLSTRSVDFLLAPDRNAVRLAKEAGTAMGVNWDFLEKKRIDSFTVEMKPKAMPVRGRTVAIVDDLISTGSTIAKAARILHDQGATRVIAACIHGLFVGDALARLRECDEVLSTDTIATPATKTSVGPDLAQAIRARSPDGKEP